MFSNIFLLFVMFLSFESFLMAMEAPKNSVRVSNDTHEPLIIEFLNTVKEASYALIPEEERVPVSIDTIRPEKSVLINADKETKYARKIKPTGTFNIQNFTKNHELFAGQTLTSMIPLTKELRAVLHNPGTKIIHLTYESIPTKAGAAIEQVKSFWPTSYIPGKLKNITHSSPIALEQKKMSINVKTDPHSIIELENLEKSEGLVKGMINLKPELERAQKTEQKELKVTADAAKKIETDRLDYDKRKEALLQEAKSFYKWGKVMHEIFNDETKDINGDSIIKALGLKGEYSPLKILDPALLELDPQIPKIKVWQKLSLAFQSSGKFDGNDYPPAKQAQKKFGEVQQIINNAKEQLSF